MGNRITILLVEDEVGVRERIKKSFMKFGYLVIEKDNGEEAIQLIRHGFPIDIVVMDIEINGKIQGIEAALEIRKISDVPIYFNTSFPELLKEALRLVPDSMASIKSDEFDTAVQNVKSVINGFKSENPPASNQTPVPPSRTIFIKGTKGNIAVNPLDIVAIQIDPTDNDWCVLHLKFEVKMKGRDPSLPTRAFKKIKLHRSLRKTLELINLPGLHRVSGTLALNLSAPYLVRVFTKNKRWYAQMDSDFTNLGDRDGNIQISETYIPNIKEYMDM